MVTKNRLFVVEGIIVEWHRTMGANIRLTQSDEMKFAHISCFNPEEIPLIKNLLRVNVHLSRSKVTKVELAGPMGSTDDRRFNAKACSGDKRRVYIIVDKRDCDWLNLPSSQLTAYRKDMNLFSRKLMAMGYFESEGRRIPVTFRLGLEGSQRVAVDLQPVHNPSLEEQAAWKKVYALGELAKEKELKMAVPHNYNELYSEDGWRVYFNKHNVFLTSDLITSTTDIEEVLQKALADAARLKV